MESKKFLLFGMLFVVLATIGLLSYHSISLYRESTGASVLGLEFRSGLREILSGLVENEANLRGFMLTKNDRFLDASLPSINRVRLRMQQVKDRTGEAPVRKQEVQRLLTLAAKRLNSTEAILSSRQTAPLQPSSFSDLVRNGEREVQEIRELVITLDNDEEARQREWSSASFQMARRATILIVLGMVSAFGLVGFANILLYQQIRRRRQAEAEKDRAIAQLQEALDRVKQLSGLLPICAGCKKIRDDKGYWNQIETYIRDHSEAEFSHSMCPECFKKWYPDLSLDELET